MKLLLLLMSVVFIAQCFLQNYIFSQNLVAQSSVFLVFALATIHTGLMLFFSSRTSQRNRRSSGDYFSAIFVGDFIGSFLLTSALLAATSHAHLVTAQAHSSLMMTALLSSLAGAGLCAAVLGGIALVLELWWRG